MRKESAETQDEVSCQGMEVDDGSLEGMGFVPSAVGERLCVKHMCDKKCNTMGFKFHDFAAIVAEEKERRTEGTPHPINLCIDY